MSQVHLQLLLISVLVARYETFADTSNGICYSKQMVIKNKTISTLVAQTSREKDDSPFKVVYITKTYEAYDNIPGCCYGYEEQSKDPLICVPSCKPDCINATCTEPDKCNCLPGYKLKTHYSCEPNCRYRCLNGECVAPDKCRCNEGYIERFKRCSPYCPSGCINGRCFKPGECECNRGYIQIASGRCIKKCAEECVENSECTVLGTCECIKGYTKVSLKCIPICSKGCKNGKCIKPNVCKCKPGFVNNKDGECIPDCSKGCTNGKCLAHNECVCNVGYVMSEEGICKPDCFNCTNGFCSGPEQCTCFDGYEENSDNSTCVPVCNKSCGDHGYCAAPDTCACDRGYQIDPKNDTNSICIPKCSEPCINGICIKPDTCICPEGYNYDSQFHIGKKCIPECSQTCIYANCTAPNTCTCDNGYEKDPDDKTNSKCMPKCEDSCVNGKCFAPNTCICDDGYKKDPHGKVCISKCDSGNILSNIDGLCKLKCSINCIHGTCYENETCSCEKGWTGSSCNKSDLCWKCDRKNTIRCANETGSCECQLGWTGPTCEVRCPLHGERFGSACPHLYKCSCTEKECSDSTKVCYCATGGATCDITSSAAMSMHKTAAMSADKDSFSLFNLIIVLVVILVLVLIVVPLIKQIRSRRKDNAKEDQYLSHDIHNPLFEPTVADSSLYEVDLQNSQTNNADNSYIKN